MKPDETIFPHHDRGPIDPLVPPHQAISPALQAILSSPTPQEPTDEDTRQELAQMEAEAIDSLIAFNNAMTAGLLQGVAMDYHDGKPRVILLVRTKDQTVPKPYTGLNIVDALIQAGCDVHEQLMYLSVKTPKLHEYVQWYRKRKLLREGQRIIRPGKN